MGKLTIETASHFGESYAAVYYNDQMIATVDGFDEDEAIFRAYEMFVDWRNQRNG